MILLPVVVLGAGIVLAIGTGNAQQSQQNCFGPVPYNCYEQGDIDGTLRFGTYDQLYSAYADFAWQDFLALNFPAALDGSGRPLPQPSPTNGLNYAGGSYVTVWETFTEARDMFLADGSQPRPFGSGHNLPDICKLAERAEEGNAANYMVSRIAKAEPAAGSSDYEVLDEYIEANRMGPVIDQNGWYLRFGISFNRDMYNYIVGNRLYNEQGQIAFDANDPNRNQNPVDWPRGVYLGPGRVDPTKIGAVMVKSAWKIFGPNDDRSRYHSMLAWIYNEAGGPFGDEPTVPESCRLAWIGLVGFHVVHRSNSAPQWVWSTFEHIDNAPWIHDFQSGTPTGKYSLFNPATCPANAQGKPSCAYNQLPPHPWNPARSYADPTQVVRIGTPGQYAIAANAAYRQKLRQSYGIGGTVWENYFMVDVQFPTRLLLGQGLGVFDTNPAYPDGLPTPSFLANSALETYIQGFSSGDVTSNGNDVPEGDQMLTIGSAARVDPWNANGVYGVSGGAQRNTSSCIDCHGDAALVNGTSGNFVFSMSRAMPAPAEKAELQQD